MCLRIDWSPQLGGVNTFVRHKGEEDTILALNVFTCGRRGGVYTNN